LFAEGVAKGKDTCFKIDILGMFRDLRGEGERGVSTSGLTSLGGGNGHRAGIINEADPDFFCFVFESLPFSWVEEKDGEAEQRECAQGREDTA